MEIFSNREDLVLLVNLLEKLSKLKSKGLLIQKLETDIARNESEIRKNNAIAAYYDQQRVSALEMNKKYCETQEAHKKYVEEKGSTLPRVNSSVFPSQNNRL